VTSEDELEALSRVLNRLERAADRLRATLSEVDRADLTVEQWQEDAALLGVELAALDAACNQVNKHFGLTSPQDRILRYLTNHVGEIVSKHQLRGVAAIYEWARRVRELRVEHGWPIATNTTRPDLKPGQYVLEAAAPDEALARRWQLAKAVRNRPGGAKDRGLAFLRAVFPEAADKDQLAYVMKISSYARRLRELDEEGWQIESNTDNPQLAPGSYRLLTLERRPPRVRQAIKLRHQILARDGHRCRDCGRSPDKHRVVLQVHHLLPVALGGGNEPDNLITLCADDHAGRHSIAESSARDELLEPSAESHYARGS
jgi:5-methylcytosine-specific restriction endonuclease McrA